MGDPEITRIEAPVHKWKTRASIDTADRVSAIGAHSATDH